MVRFVSVCLNGCSFESTGNEEISIEHEQKYIQIQCIMVQ